MYKIAIVPDALRELKDAPVFYRRLIMAAVDKQLPHEPAKATRNRKRLEPLVTGFEYDPPLWELRIQDWRIFYDINEEEHVVVIRAIRKKTAGATTGEIV